MDATILAPGEGERFSIGADPVLVKADGAATGGAFALIESVVGPGNPGPPLHIHRDDLHEFWYVLEGALRFRVGEEIVAASPGSFAHVPPGVAHTFSNPGIAPARFLGVFSPSHGLDMLREFATAFPAQGGPPDVERIAEVFRAHSVEVVSD